MAASKGAKSKAETAETPTDPADDVVQVSPWDMPPAASGPRADAVARDLETARNWLVAGSEGEPNAEAARALQVAQTMAAIAQAELLRDVSTRLQILTDDVRDLSGNLWRLGL